MWFEWDENKNQGNRIKHGLSFEIAALVFHDPNVLSELDRRYELQRQDFRQTRKFVIPAKAGIHSFQRMTGFPHTRE